MWIAATPAASNACTVRHMSCGALKPPSASAITGRSTALAMELACSTRSSSLSNPVSRSPKQLAAAEGLEVHPVGGLDAALLGERLLGEVLQAPLGLVGQRQVAQVPGMHERKGEDAAHIGVGVVAGHGVEQAR